MSSSNGISIRIERNTRKIKKIIFHDDLRSYLFRDSNRLDKEINKYRNKDYFMYVMSENGNDFGIVSIEYMQPVKLGIVECGVIESCRGKKAKQAVLMVLDNIYKKNPSIRLMGRIRKDNRKSYFFSKFFGFKLKSENNNFYVVMR